MVRVRPIPDDVWMRLAALEPRCRFSMWRDQQWQSAVAERRVVWMGIGGPPSPTRMAWRVRITPAGSAATSDFIDTAEPHLADALLAAIEAAEARGWNRPV